MNWPVVNVPVLSNIILLISFNLSKKLLPLISIPFLDAAPIPEKYESGTEIAIAQGHDITKNINALYILPSWLKYGTLDTSGKCAPTKLAMH